MHRDSYLITLASSMFVVLRVTCCIIGYRECQIGGAVIQARLPGCPGKVYGNH